MNEKSVRPPRSFMARIFLSPSPRRLRAGWRLLIQTTAMLAMLFVLGTPLVVLSSLSAHVSGIVLFAGSTIVETAAVTISVFLARRLLDRESIESLGLKLDLQTLYDLLAGLVITLFMMGFIYLAMSASGWIKFDGFAWQSEALPPVLAQALLSLLIFVAIGWNEELLSRGYQLQTLASGLGLPLGVILSSLVFGLLHLGNPNATLASAAAVFVGGLFLAFGYLMTKQLWLPIGLHIGWNFFEAVVFGFPVSGLTTFSLARITVSGPQLWTGGAFGPEAGLIVLPALALGATMVFIYARFIRGGRQGVATG